MSARCPIDGRIHVNDLFRSASPARRARRVGRSMPTAEARAEARAAFDRAIARMADRSRNEAPAASRAPADGSSDPLIG